MSTAPPPYSGQPQQWYGPPPQQGYPQGPPQQPYYAQPMPQQQQQQSNTTVVVAGVNTTPTYVTVREKEKYTNQHVSIVRPDFIFHDKICLNVILVVIFWPWIFIWLCLCLIDK